MELVSFSVKNYRSITKTEKIKLSNITVLIGPNNEGKSNILNALMLGSRILSNTYHKTSRGSRTRSSTSSYYRSRDYNWERDYPLNLQSGNKLQNTELTFEIKLSDVEIAEFKEEIKSNLNGTLPLKISIDKNESVDFKIIKSGRGSVTLNKKSNQIADFISKKIDFFYIPAIRSTDETIEQINDMIRRNLRVLNANEEYISCIKKIRELQQPVYNKIALDITQSLQGFLPQVQNVEIDAKATIGSSRYFGNTGIKIDDGTLTDLRYKGDGIQSLVAISLINKLANQRNSDKNIILSIEEPEAHLHPKAIHQLASVLRNLSETQQVIISTHSPLLIDSENIKNNIIVNDNKAKIAKNIQEMRDILGVRAPDNLTSAEFVILVEGESDCIILEKILKKKSQIISNAFKKKRLVIINTHGANKIDYLVNLYKNVHLTKVFLILDYDQAAKVSIEKLKEEKLIEENEFMYSIKRGLNESEIEDLFDFRLYSKSFVDQFGVFINPKTFNKGKIGKKKWSLKIKKCFEDNGKSFDTSNEKLAKELVADSIISNINEAISEDNKDFINSLVLKIENRLKN